MKKKLLDWFIFVLALVLTGVCMYAVLQKYGNVGCWFIFAYAAGFPVSSLLHELGHMLFGACVKLRAVPKFRLFGPSSCKIKPYTDENLKCKLIVTTCGGLALNFIFIILGIITLCVPAMPVWLSALMPASFYLFALNALPLQFESGKTDGLVLLELIKNDDTAKVLLAVMTVQAQVLKGKPIEDVDEDLLFSVPQIAEDDQAFIALTELRYEYYEAKGEELLAQKYKLRFEELKEEYL